MTIPILTDQKGFEISSLLYLPWNEPHGLNRLIEARPSTSIPDSNRGPQSPITSQYRFRVTGNGKKLTILSNNSGIKNEQPVNTELIVYDTEQKIYTRVKINIAPRTEILDFLYGDKNNIYLLQRQENAENKLIYRVEGITPEGTSVGGKEKSTGNTLTLGLLPSQVEYQKILKEQGNTLYIQAGGTGNTYILKTNVQTGVTEKWVDINGNGLDLFIDEKLQIDYIGFLPEANSRALIHYNPANGNREVHKARPEYFALLGFPIAMDAYHNVYGASGLSLSCFTEQLSAKWILPVNNIIINKDHLLLSRYVDSEKKLYIHNIANNGTISSTISIAIPRPRLRMARFVAWLSEDEWIIETIENSKELLWVFYTGRKTLTELPEGKEIPEFRIQAARSWQIDLQGNIYLPVAGSEGFYIIKIRTDKLNQK